MTAFMIWLLFTAAAFFVANSYPISGEYSGLGRLGLYGAAAVVSLIGLLVAALIALFS